MLVLDGDNLYVISVSDFWTYDYCYCTYRVRADSSIAAELASCGQSYPGRQTFCRVQGP